MNDTVKNITKECNVKVLNTLEDERDSVNVGDVVIATYFMGGMDTYEFEVIQGSEPLTLENMGNADDFSWYDLENAYHVVKKETYTNNI